MRGGETDDDHDWLGPLMAELDTPYAPKAQIHCEAVLMALTANP